MASSVETRYRCGQSASCDIEIDTIPKLLMHSMFTSDILARGFGAEADGHRRRALSFHAHIKPQPCLL